MKYLGQCACGWQSEGNELDRVSANMQGHIAEKHHNIQVSMQLTPASLPPTESEEDTAKREAEDKARREAEQKRTLEAESARQVAARRQQEESEDEEENKPRGGRGR